MQTLSMDYSTDQLIDSLVSDYSAYFASDYDESDDLYSSVDDYRSYLLTLSRSQLVQEYDSQN
jgi:hypothetical protein